MCVCMHVRNFKENDITSVRVNFLICLCSNKHGICFTLQNVSPMLKTSICFLNGFCIVSWCVSHTISKTNFGKCCCFAISLCFISASILFNIIMCINTFIFDGIYIRCNLRSLRCVRFNLQSCIGNSKQSCHHKLAKVYLVIRNQLKIQTASN